MTQVARSISRSSMQLAQLSPILSRQVTSSAPLLSQLRSPLAAASVQSVRHFRSSRDHQYIYYSLF